MATGTAVDVVMPQMGVSVSEGTITKWLKAEGEPIAADEPLLEISTDKVDTEVPSPAEGVLGRILAQEGETVPVGTVIATISPVGAQMERTRGRAAARRSSRGGARAGDARGCGGGERRLERRADRGARARAPEPQEPAPSAPAPPAPAPAQPVPAAPTGEADAGEEDGDGRAFVSPVVARIAAEHGVNVSDVAGHRTGRQGHEEGHPRLHRGRTSPTGCGCRGGRRGCRGRAGASIRRRADRTGRACRCRAGSCAHDARPLRPRPLPPRRSPARERSTSR